MARTESTMMALGTPIPAFSLPDVVTGQAVSPTASGRPLLVMFICRHCPFVIHVQHELAHLGRDYAGKADIIAISSNDAVHYPDDAPANLKRMAEELGFVFPFCYDESQAVARAFDAACTPDFFLFGKDHLLSYRGQLDASRPRTDIPVTGRDLRAALDALLAGQKPSAQQFPSIGCNIKWK